MKKKETKRSTVKAKKIKNTERKVYIEMVIKKNGRFRQESGERTTRTCTAIATAAAQKNMDELTCNCLQAVCLISVLQK